MDLDLLDIKDSADLCEQSLMGKIVREYAVNYTGRKANNEQVMV